MTFRFTVYRWISITFWILAFLAIPVWNGLCPGLHCDAQIYRRASDSLQAGRDPYVDGIKAETAFRSQLASHPDAVPPYAYLYSPLTLPLLRAVGSFPPALYKGIYWLLYAAGVLASILASMKFAEPNERRFFAVLAPAAAFFPGLIQEASLMDGNIAFILYGLLFACAYLGWRRGQWHWFYLAVLLASCFKIPMLSLLAIPLLSARKQWLAACGTGIAGVSIFLMQIWIWPSRFQHYLQAIHLEFSLGHGIGVGPAGIFGFALFNAGRPYSSASTILFVLYAIPLFGLLLRLSRRFHEGRFSLERWVPVMMVGVILLNPRVLENDFAPLTLFMAMILWRTLNASTSTKGALYFSFLFVAAINIAVLLVASIDPTGFYLNCIQGSVLIAVFSAGCWNLLGYAREYESNLELLLATPAIPEFGD